MPTINVDVLGMRDENDEERLRAALLAECGVLGVVASHNHRCAEIDYEDDELALDRVLAVIRTAGFEPRLAG
ncbi:MAG TPA: hypothetical protein VNZ57_11925 [Longimicrobiales bacterium]|nr:hypothetical protein [Longimicrobiales bacterium]